MAGREGRSASVDDGRHAAPSSPLLGQRIHDRYEVTGELGWGSLGHVYLARDHLRRAPSGEPQEVALKVIRRDRLTAESIAYLKREFRALARLEHPHVARVYDLDVVPGRGELFFSLEVLRGRTIVDVSRDGGWELAVELFVQTLRALAYVHARGLIHMDLKPPNVLVLDEATAPRVKVLDFHLAREASDPRDRTMRGTVAYMPPEVIQGQAVDHRADLYSLGAVAYEALAGTPPFAHAGSPMAALRAHVAEAPAPLGERGAGGDVPKGLEAVVLRLLAKEPARRFGSADETIRALNAALERSFALETEETLTSYLRTGTFVGRGDELERAAARGRRLLGEGGAAARPDREPWIVLLAGPGGIGKSRLLAELRVALQLEGLPVLTARPSRVDQAAYGPLREVLGELLRRTGRRELLDPTGGAVDPERLVEAAGDPELPPRVRATSALAELFGELAREAPFALGLDDLGAADEGTREVLTALAAGPRLPSLLLGAVDTEGPGADLVPELLAYPTVGVIELGQLTPAETRELLASMLAVGAVPDDLVDRVWAMTGGSPRFVEDALRALTEADAVRVRDGDLAVDAAARDELLPDVSIGELTARRVGRLEPDAAALLAACAASPRPRPLPFAAAVAGLPLPRAEGALRELEQRGLLERAPAGAAWGPLGPPLVLDHDPLRAAALEARGGEGARAIHRKAAMLLESRHPAAADPPAVGEAAPRHTDRAEELLFHLERAGEPARAFRYARQAAEAADRGGEPLHTRDLYARALELADQVAAPAVERRAVVCRYAEALAATGGRARALALLEPLAADGDAEALRLRGAFLKDQGDLGLALDHLARALAGEPTPAEVARTLVERASVRLWTGDYRAALADGEAALAALGAEAEGAAALPALDTLYHAARFLGDEAAATAFLRRGLRAARLDPRRGGIDDEGPAIHPDTLTGEGASLLGDSAGAHVPRTIVEAAFERADRDRDLLAHTERRTRLLEAAGDLDGAAYAQLSLAHLRRAAGRFAEAIGGYRRGRDLFQQAGSRIGVALSRLSLARVLADAGAPDEARAEATAAREGGRACGAPWIEGQAILAAVEADRLEGRDEAVRAGLDEAEAIARRLCNVSLQAELALTRAEVLLGAGAADEAATALAGLEALPGARSAGQELRALVAGAAVLRVEGGERALNLAEGRVKKALDQAEGRRLPELAWRAAWERSRVRRARGDAGGELADLVRAMDAVRAVAEALPADRRAPYLARPALVALRERFAAARASAGE